MKEEKKLKKKTIGVLAVSLLVAGSAFLAAGCGSSNEANDVTTQSTQAQNQVAGQSGMSVTEPDLTGVPIYPGAEKETMTMGGPGGAGGTPPSGSTDSTGSSTGTPPAPPSGDTSGGTSTPPSGDMSGGNGGTPPSGGTMPSMSMVRYTTSDDVDTVVAWYRDQLSSLDGFTESTGTFGPQNTTQTSFTFDNDGTTITIMIGEGMGQDGASAGTSITYTEGEMPSQPSGQASGQSS